MRMLTEKVAIVFQRTFSQVAENFIFSVEFSVVEMTSRHTEGVLNKFSKHELV